MTSLPILSSKDGITVVAALLGHARQTPHHSSNVKALDNIFEDIVTNLRDAIPLRQHIQVGAAAVTALIDTINTTTSDSSNLTNLQTSQSLAQIQATHEKQSSSYIQQKSYTRTDSNDPHLILPFDDPNIRIDNSTSPSNVVPSASKRPRTPIIPTQDLTNLTQSENTLPRQPPRKKRYHDAAPSTHCHVCCRPKSVVPVAVCSNIKEGTCRKVVCKRCITSNGWNWDIATEENSSWICPHCTDSCATVSRAQCWVYMRTNSRRRMRIMQNKKQKAAQETILPTSNPLNTTYSSPMEDPRASLSINPSTLNNNYAIPTTPAPTQSEIQPQKQSQPSTVTPVPPTPSAIEFSTSTPQPSPLHLPVTSMMNHTSSALLIAANNSNQQILTHSEPIQDQIHTSVPMKNVKGNINHVVHP